MKQNLEQISSSLRGLFSYDEIVLGVNHRCNLNCEFCYIDYDNSFETNEMSMQDYRNLLMQARDLGVRTYILAEREPFMTPSRTFNVINLIRQVYSSEKSQDAEIFLVSNGILADENLQEAARQGVFLDTLAFSLDGFDKTHRNLRRIPYDIKGDIAEKILQTAKKYKEYGIIKRLGMNSVLTNKNYQEIPKLIEHAHKNYPFDMFSIDVFNENPKKRNGHLKTNKKQFQEFLKETSDISRKKDIKTELIILGNRQMRPYLQWARDFGFLRGESKIDANLFYVDDTQEPFRIYYHLFPTEYVRSVRVGSDGFVMGIGLEIMKGDYRKHSIGNVKEKPLKELWDEVRAKSVPLTVEEFYF